MAPTYSPQAVDIALTSVLLAITILSALAATVASLSVYLLSSHIGLKIFRDDVLPLIEVHAPSQVQPGASQDKQGAPQDQGVPRTPPTERVTPDIINRVVWLTERCMLKAEIARRKLQVSSFPYYTPAVKTAIDDFQKDFDDLGNYISDVCLAEVGSARRTAV